MSDSINLYKVKTHNLKNISVTIPHGSITCITGVSGSGKSSLAFDTIYAESQQRYIETLDHKLKIKFRGGRRALLEDIDGISPSILVSQRIPNFGKQTDIATLSDLTDYFKLLFIHTSRTVCPTCLIEIKSYDIADIVKEINKFSEGDKFSVIAPFHRTLDENLRTDLIKKGFTRIIINNETFDIDFSSNYPNHSNFGVIIDRIKFKQGISQRLTDSLELAYKLTSGEVSIRKTSGETFLYFQNPVCPSCGFNAPTPQMRLFSKNPDIGACKICKGKGVVDENECPSCEGTGYGIVVKTMSINGKNIIDILKMTISEALNFFNNLNSNKSFFSQLINPITQRLNLLSEFIPNLKLKRKITTLSKGEIQFLRIIKHTTSPLSRITYILDEPTQSITKNEKPFLIKLILNLKNKGNTVILVEHDLDLIKISDKIIELGLGAGKNGGAIVFEGTFQELKTSKISPTALILQQKTKYPTPYIKSNQTDLEFGITNLTFRNLKNTNFKFRWNSWSVIEGAIATGKSSLLLALSELFKSENTQIQGNFFGKELFPGGLVHLDFINIPSNPHSFVASYIGIWNEIRILFASLTISKIRGYSAARFSTKNKEGHCKICKGSGIEIVKLGFVSTTELPCSKCDGSGFNPATLEILYKNKNISDILNMTIEEAGSFFSFNHTIYSKIEILKQIGLGYLTLGQKAGSLSGGEAQRLKLGKFLTLKMKKPTLYILDEPVKGLHPLDLIKFCELVQTLLSKGHTVITTDYTEILKICANTSIKLETT